MPRARLTAGALLILVAPGAAGCATESTPAPAQTPPARVQHVPGDAEDRVVLSAAAARRLGIRTAPVRAIRVSPEHGGRAVSRLAVPYAAVVYDPEGGTFTYTNPRRLVYVRHRIVVDDIEGNLAHLRQGPPAGTAVVTVGAGELLGVEEGVQE
jgi:hypothetical protein